MLQTRRMCTCTKIDSLARCLALSLCLSLEMHCHDAHLQAHTHTHAHAYTHTPTHTQPHTYPRAHTHFRSTPTMHTHTCTSWVLSRQVLLYCSFPCIIMVCGTKHISRHDSPRFSQQAKTATGIPPPFLGFILGLKMKALRA